MKKLIEEPEGQVMRAGCVTPPVGNFAEHPRSFEKAYEKKGRPPCWHQLWCAEGTRAEEDRHGWNQQRCVYGYREKDHPEEVGVIKAVDGDSQWWRSHWKGPAGVRPMSQEEFRQRPKAETERVRRRAAAKSDSTAAPKVPPPPPPEELRPAAGVEPSATPAAVPLPPPPPRRRPRCEWRHGLPGKLDWTRLR